MEMTFKFNLNKKIGTVIYFVEGGGTEFTLLKIIFGKIMGYDYIEKKRHKHAKYIDNNSKYNKVYVINTSESNITDISDTNFLDEVCEHLINEYGLDLDNAAKFYLFDRDIKSNTDNETIEHYLKVLTEPYGDDTEYEKGGLLLLSFPSIEAFVLSNFLEDTYKQRFQLGKDVKTFIGKSENQKIVQFNKIDETTLIYATNEFIKFLESIGVDLNLDEISELNEKIYRHEEKQYCLGKKYQAVSELVLSLIYLGIIEPVNNAMLEQSDKEKL